MDIHVVQTVIVAAPLPHAQSNVWVMPQATILLPSNGK